MAVTEPLGGGHGNRPSQVLGVVAAIHEEPKADRGQAQHGAGGDHVPYDDHGQEGDQKLNTLLFQIKVIIMSREHWDHDYADRGGNDDLDLGVQKQCDINQNEELKSNLEMIEEDEEYQDVYSGSISPAGGYETCTAELPTSSCTTEKSPVSGVSGVSGMSGMSGVSGVSGVSGMSGVSGVVEISMINEDEATMSSTESLIELDKEEELAGKPPDTEVDRIWSGTTSELVVGMKFRSRTEAKEFVKMYGIKQRCKMIIVSGGASEGCSSRKVI